MVSFRRLSPGTWAQIRKVAAASVTPPDETPDAFAFAAVTGAALSTEQTSNTITVAGLGSGVSVAASVSGGTYSKNGGAYVSSAGTATNGDTFAVRHTSSESNSTVVTTTLTLGSVSAGFLSTTLAAVVDTTPDAFSFTDATEVALSSTQTSNTITVAGINAPATVTITGGSYSKNGGGYVSTAGTAQNGDTFAVQHTASASNSTATNTVLTIGGVSDTFTSTTAAGGPFTLPATVDSGINSPASTFFLTSGQTTYPPTFSMELDDTHYVGDTAVIERADSDAFTTGLTYYTATITLANLPVSAGGSNAPLDMSPDFPASGTYRYRPYIVRGSVRSATPGTFITHGPNDTAPLLTLPTETGISSQGVTLGFTTDWPDGEAEYVVTGSATQPTATQVKAGQDHTGAAATKNGTLAITSAGAKTFPGVTGLPSPSTTYHYHIVHTPAVGPASAVLSDSFATTAAGPAAVFPNGSTGTTERSPSVSVTGGNTVTGTATTNSNSGVKADLTMPDGGSFEVTITNISNDQIIFAGVCDASHAFGPAQTYTIPGRSGEGAGFTALIKGNSPEIYTHSNGSAGGGNYNFAGAVVADGDKVRFTLDLDTNSIAVEFKSGAGSYVALPSSPFALTSQVPTEYKAFVGVGSSGDIATVTFSW